MFVESESGRGGWFVCKGRNPIPVSLYRFLFRLARWICPNELRVFLFQDRGKETTCFFFFLIFCLSFFCSTHFFFLFISFCALQNTENLTCPGRLLMSLTRVLLRLPSPPLQIIFRFLYSFLFSVISSAAASLFSLSF